jgi:4'-phosphopantetheinyl transferase EntD
VAKRQAEYLAGRYVAKQALKNLNLTDINIPIGSNGCPIWPINISASITHTNNIAICACADQKKYQYLGIDLEKIVSSQCATDIIDSIANPFEKNLLRKIPINISKALTLLFSAKESLYKALYSSVGHYFDFKEAQLTNVSLENNSFGIILLKNLNPQLKADKQFNGYFAFYDEYVFSIIAQ